MNLVAQKWAEWGKNPRKRGNQNRIDTSRYISMLDRENMKCVGLNRLWERCG